MILWLIAVPLVAAELFSQGREPLDLRSKPELINASACTSCHAEEGAAWEQSAHHRASTNKRYAVATPQPWCKNCHAPVTASEGVNCATCHVRDNQVLTPHRVTTSAHTSRFEPSMTQSSFCSGCHDFHFPTQMQMPIADHVTDSSELLQSVFAEWTQTQSGTCQSCHVQGHRFITGRKKDTITVSAKQCDGETNVRLRVKGVGHAFPTGDPFRRAIVEVWNSDGKTSYELGHQTRRHGERYTFANDTRIQPCKSDVCEELLTFTQPATHWRLRYLYANPHDEPRLTEAEREVVLAEGRVDPTCAAPAQ